MIAALTGKLLAKPQGKIILDVQGVGYEVSIASDPNKILPEPGETLFLYIYTHVREDTLQLFGFFQEEEKQVFLLLIGVSGIGPKVALNILAATSPGNLCSTIASEDLPGLIKLPGIGKKTAERLCLELKDKIKNLTGLAVTSSKQHFNPVGQEDTVEDVISALSNLGYPANRAKEAIEIVSRKHGKENFSGMSLEELLRESLRALA
jgi:holliday junction DNA helicase RuvA